MSSRPNPQPPASSMHFVLRPPEPMSYRDGYIADVVKLNLETSGRLHPDDSRVIPGIYVHDGEVREKLFPNGKGASQAGASAAASPTLDAPSGKEHSFPSPYSCSQSARLSDLALALSHLGLACSAPTSQATHADVPPPPPPSNFTPNPKFFVRARGLTDTERTPSISIGRLSELRALDGHPYIYSYCAEILLFPDNSFDPIEMIGPDGKIKPAVFLLRIDTGGGADSWVFGNIPWQVFRLLSEEHEYTDEQLQTEFHKKNLVPIPDYHPGKDDIGKLLYGLPGEITSVLVKRGLCTMVFQQWDRAVRIRDFPIGVVYGAHDGHILAQFDGLLGLGRSLVPYSRMPAGARHGPAMTFQDALFKQGLIKSTDFWVHITHPTWDASGRDFICFGDYLDRYSGRVPTWLDVDCSVDSPLWTVVLSKIVVFDVTDGKQRLIMEHNFQGLPVATDTGAMQSYFPQAFVSKVEEKFSEWFKTPAGYASYHCPKNLVVRFVFGNGQNVVSVDGQAIRFFISPNYVAGEHPAIDIKASARGLLGLNFFRTFIVGFKDHATKPRICLAKHPDVLPNQPYVSACKDAINRAAMHNAQLNAQQQQSAREAGPSSGGPSDSTRVGASGERSAAATGAPGHSTSGKPTKLQKAAPKESSSGAAQHQRLGSSSTRVHVSEPTPPQVRPAPNSGSKSHARAGSQSHTRPEGQSGSAAAQNPPARPQQEHRRTESAKVPFPQHAGTGPGPEQLPRERRVSHSQLPQDPRAPQSIGYRAPPPPDPYASRGPAPYPGPQPPQPQPYPYGGYYAPAQQPDPRAPRTSRAPLPDGHGYAAAPPDQRPRQTSQSYGAPATSGAPVKRWHPRDVVEQEARAAGVPLKRSVSNTQPYAPIPGPYPPAQYPAQYAPVVPPGNGGHAASSSQRPRKLSGLMNMFHKR